MTTGKPMRSATTSASSSERASPLAGCFRFSSCNSRWKRSRSSARSMASGEVPRMGIPALSKAWAIFSGVCPPNCTMQPSTVPLRCSTRTSSITSSAVSGSKYRRSAVS